MASNKKIKTFEEVIEEDDFEGGEVIIMNDGKRERRATRKTFDNIYVGQGWKEGHLEKLKAEKSETSDKTKTGSKTGTGKSNGSESGEDDQNPK